MIPIAERMRRTPRTVATRLRAAGVRVEVDARNEMNGKIREHAMKKVPFLLVSGTKKPRQIRSTCGRVAKRRPRIWDVGVVRRSRS